MSDAPLCGGGERESTGTLVSKFSSLGSLIQGLPYCIVYCLSIPFSPTLFDLKSAS